MEGFDYEEKESGKLVVRCPICGEEAEYIYWKKYPTIILGCDKCVQQVRAEDAKHED